MLAIVNIVAGAFITLPESSFDLASAFDAVYFWYLTGRFSQIHKALKDGGIFLIVNSDDGELREDKRWVKLIYTTKISCTREDLEEALKQAGFSSVRSYHHETKPWIAVLAVR